MMTRTLTLAATALAAATAPGCASAAADRHDVTATYNTQSRQFCIHRNGRDDADTAEPSIYRKPCRNAAQWRAHGIRFREPVASAEMASAR